MMITATIFLHDYSPNSIQAQLMAVPRISETITIALPGCDEKDLEITGINHFLDCTEQTIKQTELVIFAIVR